MNKTKMACPTMIQVTNVSPQATLQQMKELFSYMGDITELMLYPQDENMRLGVPSKVCFVNFTSETSVAIALHMTNTIFVDRALIVARSRYATFPDEEQAMSLAAPAIAIANQSIPMAHTAPLLPTPPTVNSVLTAAGITPTPQIPGVQSTPTPPQPPLISLMGTVVPTPPPLTGNVDPTKIEEIRRTVYVGNLNSSLTAEQILTFFQPCGEIKYVRMAGDETQPTRFAFIEFATPESVPTALQYNGAMFGDRPIKVNYSKNAIVKPQGPTAQEAKREVEEAMRKVREATMAIAASIVPLEEVKPAKTKSRSRSRSRERKRHRSSSRSRDHQRRRSRSPRGLVSSRGHYRSPPRRRYRSRSRSPPRRRRDSHYRGRRSRSRSKSRSPRDHRRERERRRSRDRDRDKGRRSSPRRSPSFSPSPKKPKSSRRRDKDRDRDKERGRGSRSPSPNEERSRSSKKSKKHRHRRRTPTPSPSPSPERSPGSPREDKGPQRDEEDRNSSVGSGSPRLGYNDNKKESNSDVEMDAENGGSRNSASPAKVDADSDSSF